MRKPIYQATYEVTYTNGKKEFFCQEHMLSERTGGEVKRLPSDATIDCITCKYDHVND